MRDIQFITQEMVGSNFVIGVCYKGNMYSFGFVTTSEPRSTLVEIHPIYYFDGFTFRQVGAFTASAVEELIMENGKMTTLSFECAQEMIYSFFNCSPPLDHYEIEDDHSIPPDLEEAMEKHAI